jgi:hypothetical protein
VPKVTDGSLYRPWGECHDPTIEPSTIVRLGRQEGTPMDLGNPVVLIVALVAGLSVLMLGLSWLFNGSWPWQRPPHGSDEIDRDRFGSPGLLGRFFPGGGGGDGGAGGS